MAHPLTGGRPDHRAGLVAALLVVAAGLPTLNSLLVGVFYDDGLYAGLATALARGDGYAHPHLPGAPRAIHYPPLYPLVLAPLFGLLPVPAAALAGKVLNILLGGAAAGLAAMHAVRHRLLGARAPTWLAVALVVGAATAIPVLTVQAVLFAEPLFAVLLGATFVAADGDAVDRGQPRRALAAGALAALAVLCRAIAVSAAAGAVLHLARRWRAARPPLLAVAPPAVAAVGWALWVLVHRDGIDPALAANYGSYAETLRQAGFTGLGAGAPELLRPLAAITVGWVPTGPGRVVAGAAALAIGAYGLVLLARRSSVGLTLLAYFAILIVWPYPPDRFLWAVMPWLTLAWGAGALALWERRRLHLPVALAAAAVVVGFAQYQVRGVANRWWEGAARDISANFTELLPAIRELPAEAVVATDDEALVWLYTGRRAVPLYLYAYQGRQIVRPDIAAHRAYLARQGVTHVLLASASGESGGRLRELMVADPAWLVPVRGWPGARWLFAVADGGSER